jgi:hypothetical protein
MKTFGTNNEGSLGYGTQKRCLGGANALATCSNDTACPGSTCVAQMEGTGNFYLDRLLLVAGLEVSSLDTKAKSSTSNWGRASSSDLTSLTSDWVDIADNDTTATRTITRLCWRTNATGATISLRRYSGTAGTPIPTPALPTPAAMATPGFTDLDSGCLTSQSITWPPKSQLQGKFTAGSGVKTSLVSFGWTVQP